MSSLEYLLSAKAIRESASKVWDYTLAGRGHFEIHEEKLPELANYVCDVIRDKYPDLNIPYHSRWGHLNVGDGQRLKKFKAHIQNMDPLERGRVQFDLVIPSVLLDAGAGSKWKYLEESSGNTFNRSEGLAVASYYLFEDGVFSCDTNNPFMSSAKALKNFNNQLLEQYFQVAESNPLVGVEGRVLLINQLGEALENKKEFFPNGRIGDLVDYLKNKFGSRIEATSVLETVLKSLGSIWPGRIEVDGVNLGDVWSHSQISSDNDNLLVFHKLSQWLTYSLIEPLEDSGFEILKLNDLTGLAEYRNGGLFVDGQLLEIKNKELLDKAHKPSSDIILEWRALTISLLDRIAFEVRSQMKLSEDDFPLAKVLEGGTWHAGRKIAKSMRADSSPPIKLDSDGTVF